MLDDDLTRTGELVACTLQRQLCRIDVIRFRSDLEDRLAFPDLSCGADRLSKAHLHACAHTVRTCAGRKRVLSENMMGIDADFHVVQRLSDLLFKKSIACLASGFDRVIPKLHRSFTNKAKYHRKHFLEVPHIKAHNLAVGISFDECLLLELGSARVWPLDFTVRAAFSNLYHTVAKKEVLYKGFGGVS